MTHRFPVKEIALQAGLSTATVDRVLNNRPNVSPQTAQRVHDAIAELKDQERQLSARGRRLFIDVVVEAPARFSREIKSATDAILADLRPLALRPRFVFEDTMTEEACIGHLNRIAKRGSHGICLKARDTLKVRKAIQDLASKRIPLVTVFTDCPGSERIAYAGLNNFKAGETAAYLMHQWLPREASTVLTTLSQFSFQGEEDRLQGFQELILKLRPGLDLVDVSGGGGLNQATGRRVEEMLRKLPSLEGVYSMGGGNLAISAALQKAGIKPQVFIAHDLDEDNLYLLQNHSLTVVLYHNLRTDMLAAFRHILAYHRLGTPPPQSQTDIQIITPWNIPAGSAA